MRSWSGTQQRAGSTLGERLVDALTDAAMHTPAEVTGARSLDLQNPRADLIVAPRGGSAIGLSKAIALRMATGQTAIPSDYTVALCSQGTRRGKNRNRTERISCRFAAAGQSVALDNNRSIAT